MNECEKHELAVSCYVDGELERSLQVGLFSHIAACEQCAEFLQQSIYVRVEAARNSRLQPMAEIGRISRSASDQPAIPSIRRKGVLALMHRQVLIPIPVASAIAVCLIIGTLVLSSFVLRTQEPQSIFITTLPGIEVEARNP